MKHLLILLALALAAASASEPGLRVKFGISFSLGTDCFYDIPKNISRAVQEGWVLTQRADGHLPALVMYCPTDYILCGYYDNGTGFIGGLQIALSQDNFTNNPFDWATQGFTEWTPSTTNGTSKFWITALYFFSEEFMAKSVEDRIACRNESKFLQEDAVWLTNFNKRIDKVPADRAGIENSTYTTQACLPWMGRHFFYNMSSTTPCQADTMCPWFMLVQKKCLAGIGCVVFGNLPIEDNKRDWFERPSEAAVQIIVPNGPQCLYNLAAKYKVLTMHIYFKAKPWWFLNCFGE